jgi:hypothetical protein
MQASSTETTGGGESTAAPAGSILATAAPVETPDSWLPEKYQVKNEAGLDLEGSAKKMADAYRALEKRLGTGDLPPESPEKYAIEGLPETFSIEDLKADPKTQGFLKGAHAKGMTNAQVSYVLAEYARVAPELVQGAAALDAGQAKEQLAAVWKDETEFTSNLKHSWTTTNIAAEKAGLSMDDIEAAGLGNNPTFLRIMAALGPEFAEDTPINSAGIASKDTTIEELERSDAYRDPKHKDHASVSAQIKRYYEKRYGNAPVSTLFTAALVASRVSSVARGPL